MTKNRDPSPVAVVGFSFRMPGARGEDLWNALLAGRDLVTSVEPDRWAQDTLLHSNKAEPGTSYTFAAGSIGDVAGFDAAFFGISPREAEQMDPQQRVLLEMTLEAFEQAGVPPASMRGSRCGVYVGALQRRLCLPPRGRFGRDRCQHHDWQRQQYCRQSVVLRVRSARG